MPPRNRFGRSNLGAVALVTGAGKTLFLAVTTASQNISAALESTKLYLLTVDVDVYVRQDGVAASAAAGSAYLPAGSALLIAGVNGATLAIMGKTSAGVATLAEVEVAR